MPDNEEPITTKTPLDPEFLKMMESYEPGAMKKYLEAEFVRLFTEELIEQKKIWEEEENRIIKLLCGVDEKEDNANTHPLWFEDRRRAYAKLIKPKNHYKRMMSRRRKHQ
jgi:hypothetical protein